MREHENKSLIKYIFTAFLFFFGLGINAVAQADIALDKTYEAGKAQAHINNDADDYYFSNNSDYPNGDYYKILNSDGYSYATLLVNTLMLAGSDNPNLRFNYSGVIYTLYNDLNNFLYSDQEEFNFNNGVFYLTEDLGDVRSGGNYTLVGGTGYGSINAGGNELFKVGSGTTLVLNKISIYNPSSSAASVLNNNGGDVNMDGVIIDGGNIDINGAAISNNGTLRLNGTIQNFKSLGSQGGAIYNNGTLTFTGATFRGNNAGNLTGAIYNRM